VLHIVVVEVYWHCALQHAVLPNAWVHTPVKRQPLQQEEGSSHCSPGSTTPLPQTLMERKTNGHNRNGELASTPATFKPRSLSRSITHGA
jgi:hypothetical protein